MWVPGSAVRGGGCAELALAIHEACKQSGWLLCPSRTNINACGVLGSGCNCMHACTAAAEFCVYDDEHEGRLHWLLSMIWLLVMIWCLRYFSWKGIWTGCASVLPLAWPLASVILGLPTLAQDTCQGDKVLTAVHFTGICVDHTPVKRWPESSPGILRMSAV